jgi:hypothetical protein
MPWVSSFVVGVVVGDCEGFWLDLTALCMLEEFGIVVVVESIAMKQTYRFRD